MARVAIVDPNLIASCSREQIAANGMDAFTQLFESYCSTRANPISKSLAWDGMKVFVANFERFWSDPLGESEAREQVAYASLLSGICLAQTGLGAVHGMAAPLGAMSNISHGVACGTLLAETTRQNLQSMLEREPNNPAIELFAEVGVLVTGGERQCDTASALDGLIDTLGLWVQRYNIPRLSAFGVEEADLRDIARQSGGSSMKTNPIVLQQGELMSILSSRL